MSSLTLIVAATNTNGIGHATRLPWRLPREMAYFARVTSDAPLGSVNAVIMGRNTWESIPAKFRPLKNRVNIVISRNPTYDLRVTAPDPTQPAFLHTDLASALARLADMTVHREFIIGGACLYNEALGFGRESWTEVHPLADRILLTRVVSPPFNECDVFLPEFRERAIQHNGHRGVWKQASHEELQAWVGGSVPDGLQEEKGVQYEYQLWVPSTPIQ